MSPLPPIRLALLLGAAMSCASCDRSERNVISGRAPFFQETMPYNSAETERVISAVHKFADANGMDFLLSRDGPDRGDYNATAAGSDLNFKVIHVSAVDPKRTDVVAYALAAPTDADRKRATVFACVVKGGCR